MERKTITIDLMLAATILGVVYQEIDNPAFILIWICIGLFLGLIEPKKYLGDVFLEIAMGSLILFFLGVVFELALHEQIFVSFPESDHSLAYFIAMYQSLLIGAFTALGAAFPIIIRLDKSDKQEPSKEESSNIAS